MSNDQVTDPEEVAAEDLPDVPAFEDDFTRGFLTSINETKEGYYPFLSGTKKYEMDFPEDGVIHERTYAVDNKNAEGFFIILKGKDSNYEIDIEYYSFKSPNRLDHTMENIKKNIEKELDFEEIDTDPQIETYIASYEYPDGEFGYVVIAQHEHSGAIQLTYKVECDESDKDCNLQKVKKIVESWASSINFIND